jgi:hypothetical protein
VLNKHKRDVCGPRAVPCGDGTVGGTGRAAGAAASRAAARACMRAVQRRAAQPPPPRARADECGLLHCDAAMLLRVRVCARVHCMACMALSQLLRVRSGLRTSVSKSYDHRAFCGPSVTSQVCVCEENIGWSTYKKHRVGHLPDIAFFKKL